MTNVGWVKRIPVPPSIKRDIALMPALFLFNCFSFSAWTKLSEVPTSPWLLLLWLYGLVGLAPLAWRDQAPLTVFVTQCIITVAAWPIFDYYTPVVGIPVALYAVSAHCGKGISLLALLASCIPNGLAAAVAFKVYSTPHEYLSSFIQNAIFLFLMAGGAWGAGRLTQASQRHVQYLERERETTRNAVVEERRRIARELHDIISHAVTIMILQASGAAEIADIDLAQTKRSLKSIETTGRQAMVELRRLLGVLVGNNSTHDGQGIDERSPQPGLENLTTLLHQSRAAGVPIIYHVEGKPCELDPSVELATYWIVREGLTNVLKHAGKDAKPQLRLAWESHRLLIEIDNGTNQASTYTRESPPFGYSRGSS
jgi:signal transduction histidine kinase